MESRFQFYRSKRVKYSIVGEGEPLVLIHGYQADSRVWQKMIPLLQEKYFLIIPDLPGHGQSPIIQTTNTMEFLAEIVYNICLSLGFKGVSLAGHSMGGYVALAFADKYKGMTDRLVLINAYPFEDSITKILARNREAELIMQGKKELLLRNFVKYNFSATNNNKSKEVIELATEIALSQPENGMLADLSGMMVRVNKTKLLNNFRGNVDFILGADDEKLAVKNSTKLSLDKASTHYIENCGHMSILEKPEEVAAIILNQ
jgi:pimeloyl-ACP methyl ester carboxylesterase